MNAKDSAGCRSWQEKKGENIQKHIPKTAKGHTNLTVGEDDSQK